jgi:hypothetical protein
METTKMSFEYQVKSEKDKYVKIEKELDKLKTERAKWETKAQAVEAELSVRISRRFVDLQIHSIFNFRYRRSQQRKRRKLSRRKFRI